MKAYNKYKVAAKQGNREAQRRIAQGYGYKISIHDVPLMRSMLESVGVSVGSDTDLISL